MTFRSPAVAADVVLLLVLLPIATVSLAFLLLIVIVGAAQAAGLSLADGTALWTSGIVALAVVAVFVRRKLFWSITLADRGVRLGRIWPRHVAYDRIRFIVAGSLANPSIVVGLTRSGAVPLAFSTGPLRTERIFLRRSDADVCVRALHQRARNASAIDFGGRVHAPKDGVALPYARFKLAQTLGVRAAVAFGTIVASVIVIVAITAGHARPTDNRAEAARTAMRQLFAVRYSWTVIAAMPALAAYGAVMLRRAKAVIRGRLDQAEV